MGVFEKLCERYLSHFKYDEKTTRKIGIEKEILITKDNGYMDDVTQSLWPYFKAQDFKKCYDNFYTDTVIGFDCESGHITTDAGKGTVEIILNPLNTIQECEIKMKKGLEYLLLASDFNTIQTGEKKHIIGLGYQPLQKSAAENWNKKQRYEVMLSYFKDIVYNSALSASDQVHLDISLKEFVSVVNVLNGLAGFIMVLFSNSPVVEGKKPPIHAYREMFWDGLGSDRTGVPATPFVSTEDYLNRIWNLTCVMAKKDNYYYAPDKLFKEMVLDMKDDNEVFDIFCTHEGAVWFCARPRVFGTVETRPTCLQPWDAMMTVPTFMLGIVENLVEAQEFIKDFDWNFLVKLRGNAAKEGFNLKIKDKSISIFLHELLEISKRGLKKRGFEEELYLVPLYKRVEKSQGADDYYYKIFKEEGIHGLLEKTSLKKEFLQ